MAKKRPANKRAKLTRVAKTAPDQASLRAFKPVNLTFTLPKEEADWLKRQAAEEQVPVSELIRRAVRVHRYPAQEPRITRAISEGSGRIKTGRYEP